MMNNLDEIYYVFSLKNHTYIIEVSVKRVIMTDWTSSIELAGSDPEWKSKLCGILSQADWSVEITPVVDKLKNGERLTLQDGMILFNHKDLFELGRLATS